jgi:glutathione S-transferase
MAGLDCEVAMSGIDDASARAELLLLSPSFLVPCLTHDGNKVWDTLAIAEYLNEIRPGATLLPEARGARAHCRSICGEMHSGFSNLRSALPMNLRAHYPAFKVWAGVQADIDRVVAIWRECLAKYGGPFLFGAKPTMADAMYAPVCTRFITYDVKLDSDCAAYCAAGHEGLDRSSQNRAGRGRRARRGVLTRLSCTANCRMLLSHDQARSPQARCPADGPT